MSDTFEPKRIGKLEIKPFASVVYNSSTGAYNLHMQAQECCRDASLDSVASLNSEAVARIQRIRHVLDVLALSIRGTRLPKCSNR